MSQLFSVRILLIHCNDESKSTVMMNPELLMMSRVPSQILLATHSLTKVSTFKSPFEEVEKKPSPSYGHLLLKSQQLMGNGW